MIEASEAVGYGQWIATNFYAVPALMLAAVLAVLDVGAVIGYFMHRQRFTLSADIAGRLVLLLTLNVAMGWWLHSLIGIVAWAKLVTVGNALFVTLPAILIALLTSTVLRTAGRGNLSAE